MFRQFNETTLHLLAFELLEERRFKFGEVIKRQHKRSLLNQPHTWFLRRQPNAILVSILEQRQEIDRFGKDLAISNFALALKEVARMAKRKIESIESTRTCKWVCSYDFVR